jgi:UDP-N-acetylmuramoyl-tripeptide--D-alanyl-D-alanine ligase
MISQIEKIHSYILKGSKVSTDTRQIEPGSIFFALKGEKFDANDFALQALQKGAVLVVADKKDLHHPAIIVVDDSLKALQELAVYHRNQFRNIPFIGITGSNGKTTTKELINAVVTRKYKTLCTKGNLNNHIGVPLTLLNLTPEHEMAIIEMGANHMGEIGFLSSLAQPDFGLITNIGKAHIEGFGSFENIITGKTELYDFIRKSGGNLFLNSDNPILKEKSIGIEAVTYGRHQEASVQGEIISSSPFLQIRYWSAKTQGKVNISSQLLGAYNFENIMSAITIGEYFGVEPADIKAAIEEYAPVNSRSQLKDSGTNSLILDSYNANPTSMRAAIENFSNLQTENPKGLILGDMLEMGDSAEYEHNDIIELTLAHPYKFVVLVGSHFLKACPDHKAYHAFADSDSAARWVCEQAFKGFSILIKGSRGIQLEKIEKHL